MTRILFILALIVSVPTYAAFSLVVNQNKALLRCDYYRITDVVTTKTNHHSIHKEDDLFRMRSNIFRHYKGHYRNTDRRQGCSSMVLRDEVNSIANVVAKPTLIVDLGLSLDSVQATKGIMQAVSNVTGLLETNNNLSPPSVVNGEVPLTQFASDSTMEDIRDKKQLMSLDSTKQSSGSITLTVESPSVMKILKFAIPAIGVWLCGPILSLIDTSAVGLLSGVTQQAALNPATAVTDYAALLIAFMYTGSTNLIAAAREKRFEGEEQNNLRTNNLFIGALQLSTYVGLILGASLIVSANVLLRTIIGNDSINPDVFEAAMKYVRIRALGMPAAAVIGTAQAACLGMQDIRSPLYILLAAAVVNFIGDMIFVRSPNLWLGGSAGAAWATVLSQYSAVVLFVYWLKSKPNMDNMRKTELKVKSEQTPESFSVRGLLQSKFRNKDLLNFPPRSILKDFFPYFGPVTSTVIGRVSGYIAMSHVVSSSLGTFSMAAQQVIVSIFYCLCPVADSLSLTAQSFVPAISAKKVSNERAAALQQTFVNFMKAGGLFGALLAGTISCLPLISRLFTPDARVVSLVNGVTPLLMTFFAVHGLLCASEGLLLGQKDLSFLGRMYTGFFFIVPFLMMSVKRAALSGAAVGLTNVWTIFVGYQLFRTCAWVGRAAWIQRQTNREALKSMMDS